MQVRVRTLHAEANRCHSVQTGVYFRKVEVGQLVARKPSLGVAHVTQVSVSPVFLSFPPCPSQEPYLRLQLSEYPFQGLTEDIFYRKTFLLILIPLQALKFPAVSCRCWCSVAVRMQQLALKVLCSTLLLLAVMPSVHSQSGMCPSTCLTIIFLLNDHLSVYWSYQKPVDVSSYT